MAVILVVDDEAGIRDFVATTLRGEGYEVVEAADGAAALEQIDARRFDLMLLDLRMPGSVDGLDLLRHARVAVPGTPVIILSAHGSVSSAVEAMRLGAIDFLEKPLDGPGELRRLAARALNRYLVDSVEVSPRRDDAESAGARAPVGRAGDAAPIVSDLQRFLFELRRRRVYKVAATYGAAGYVILEVAQLVVSGLPIPEWTYTGLVLLVLLGLPLVLVLGWVFDVHVSRTPPVSFGTHRSP